MNGQTILMFVLLGGFLLIFALVVIAFCVGRTVSARIEGFSWFRKLFLEHYIWVQASSYSGFPSGSRKQHSEVESYQSLEHVRDDTITTTSADGQTITTTQPVSEFVTRSRTKYSYEIQEWVKSRGLLAKGRERATVHWPAYVLDRSTHEQVESTQEQYLVHFQTAKGKKYQRALPETDWAALDDQSIYLLKVNMFGHILNVTPSQTAKMPMVGNTSAPTSRVPH